MQILKFTFEVLDLLFVLEDVCFKLFVFLPQRLLRLCLAAVRSISAFFIFPSTWIALVVFHMLL